MVRNTGYRDHFLGRRHATREYIYIFTSHLTSLPNFPLNVLSEVALCKPLHTYQPVWLKKRPPAIWSSPRGHAVFCCYALSCCHMFSCCLNEVRDTRWHQTQIKTVCQIVLGPGAVAEWRGEKCTLVYLGHVHARSLGVEESGWNWQMLVSIAPIITVMDFSPLAFAQSSSAMPPNQWQKSNLKSSRTNLLTILSSWRLSRYDDIETPRCGLLMFFAMGFCLG